MGSTRVSSPPRRSGHSTPNASSNRRRRTRSHPIWALTGPPGPRRAPPVTSHAITPKHDLHEMEKQKFAHQVAHEINRASAQGAFEQVVLVAPAHTLKEIRDKLDTTTAAKLVGTLQKDLIRVPDHELAPHLDE